MSVNPARKIRRKCYHFVIILLSLLLITFFTTVAPVGAFFQVFFGAKKWLFLIHFFMWPLCSLFFTIITYINFVIFRNDFAQDSKNSWENGQEFDVQKWDRRNTFGKIRRALGDLRNFFGTNVMTPYMLSWHLKIKMGKKLLARKCTIGWCDSPQNGQTCFSEKGFPIFGTYNVIVGGAFF